MERSEEGFEGRVAEVLERIDPTCRDVAGEDVDDLLRSGVRSEEDLFAIVENPASDPQRRARAFWLLSRLGTAGTTPALFRALADADASVRAAAARSIGESGIPESVRRLTTVLRDDVDAGVRQAAAYALGLVGDPGAVSPLVAALKDPAASVRGMAAEALADVGDRAAVAPLLEALEDPEAEVRYWAAFALGGLGGDDCIPVLRALAERDHAIAPGRGSIRDEAEAAILRIGQRRARPTP